MTPPKKKPIPVRRPGLRRPLYDTTGPDHDQPEKSDQQLGTPGEEPTGTGTQLLYTPEEAAEKLRVRPSWLRRKASTRAIPCRFIGKHLRFADEDLRHIAGLSTPHK